MSIFRATVNTFAIGQSGSEKLVVICSTSDKLEEVSEKVQRWAELEYVGNVVTSTELIHHGNSVYVTDLYHDGYHKVVVID